MEQLCGFSSQDSISAEASVDPYLIANIILLLQTLFEVAPETTGTGLVKFCWQNVLGNYLAAVGCVPVSHPLHQVIPHALSLLHLQVQQDGSDI